MISLFVKDIKNCLLKLNIRYIYNTYNAPNQVMECKISHDFINKHLHFVSIYVSMDTYVCICMCGTYVYLNVCVWINLPSRHFHYLSELWCYNDSALYSPFSHLSSNVNHLLLLKLFLSFKIRMWFSRC